MKSPKNKGRTVGLLLLLQLAAGLMIPFILMHSLISGSPGFLKAAAENSFQIRSAVLLSFVGAALTVSLGIIMTSVFRRYSSATAILFLVVCVISCVLDAVHGGTVMSMLSLSQQSANAGTAANAEMYELVGAAVASSRRWTHSTQLVAIGVWIFVFYSSLFRFALIPRALAALGMIGILLQFTGITLMMLLGYGTIAEMAMPLLPIQITAAVWLMVKGFNEQLPETVAEPGF